MKRITDNPAFNLVHLASGIKIDVFVPKPSPWLDTRMKRASLAAFDEDPQAKRFFIASSEDMILSKLAWYESGNPISDKQWNDIVGILKIQQSHLDRLYLEDWARRLNLAGLLERALTDARIAE